MQLLEYADKQQYIIYTIYTIKHVILNYAAVSIGLSVAVILVVIASGVILFWLFQKRHSQK